MYMKVTEEIPELSYFKNAVPGCESVVFVLNA